MLWVILFSHSHLLPLLAENIITNIFTVPGDLIFRILTLSSIEVSLNSSWQCSTLQDRSADHCILISYLIMAYIFNWCTRLHFALLPKIKLLAWPGNHFTPLQGCYSGAAAEAAISDLLFVRGAGVKKAICTNSITVLSRKVPANMFKSTFYQKFREEC